MSTKNHFSQLQELFFDLREKAIRYKESYPERIIGAMFLILLVAVTIFLITKATRQQSHSGSANRLLGRISAPAPTPPDKPIAADIMGLLGLYGKARGINPDSLTLKDSVLLKEINQDLNNILK